MSLEIPKKFRLNCNSPYADELMRKIVRNILDNDGQITNKQMRLKVNRILSFVMAKKDKATLK